MDANVTTGGRNALGDDTKDGIVVVNVVDVLLLARKNAEALLLRGDNRHKQDTMILRTRAGRREELPPPPRLLRRVRINC